MYIPIQSGSNNLVSPASSVILAGDIGATKTNLALYQFAGKGFSILKENKYPTKDFTDIGKMITAFLSGDGVPDRICFGVAGPVQNGKVDITNVSWHLDSDKISEQYNNIPVYLINDLEATAYGIAMLAEEDIHIIYEPGQKISGNIALIAPGTGLGEAGLYWDGTYYHPFATEGGHCDFAPRTEMDTELYLHLHKKFGHVSWERLISGAGIIAIFEFLQNKKDREVPAWLVEKMLAHDPAAVISENAEEAAICHDTIELFLRFLATEAANLTLKLKATGGVFIGGGILPKIIRLVHPDHFLKWFRDCGRMKSLLENVPVRIILNDKTALLGAAYYGAYKEIRVQQHNEERASL